MPVSPDLLRILKGKAMIQVTAFVSYDHQDYLPASYVRQRLSALFLNTARLPENRYGPTDQINIYAFNVWMDSTSIPLGSQWEGEIERGIRSCDLFILVASQVHVSSYVKREINVAMQLGKPIFPLYSDSPDALKWYGLGHVQGYRIPVSPSDSTNQAFDRTVIKALDHLI